MTTQIIGIKEFRNNITSLWRKARQQKTRYIVMHHSTPIFDVQPLAGERLVLSNFAKEITEAREQVKKGMVYSEEDVYKQLGI